MLEHIPAWLGHAMSGLRAGADKLAIAQLGTSFETLDLTSPAFAHEARMPPRFTADGEGVSPPLVWNAPPAGTAPLGGAGEALSCVPHRWKSATRGGGKLPWIAAVVAGTAVEAPRAFWTSPPPQERRHLAIWSQLRRLTMV